MKRSKPDVQGDYEAVFQPDPMPVEQKIIVLGSYIMLTVILLSEAVVAEETWERVVILCCAGAMLVMVGWTVFQEHWYSKLAFGVSPEALTVLWDGKPARIIPWWYVIEVFTAFGPCESRHGSKYAPPYCGVYVSLQYGYESRLSNAKREILNWKVRWDTGKHLDDFPVMRLYESQKQKDCQTLLRKIEGYRNAAWSKGER